MRKILSLTILSFTLNGCLLSGPMALLPPAAKYLLWNSNDEVDANENGPISVSDLLKGVKKYESPDDIKEISPIIISYEDLSFSDNTLIKFASSQDREYEMICGPYEYGAPLQAASLALQACSNIKKQLIDKGIRLNVHFSPTAKKGQASIKEVRINEASDA